MKKFILFILILTISGCHTKQIIDYKELMKDNEYVIIDVRTLEEYNESHIVGAINIPYDQIDNNVDLDKEKIILVYCKSGNRSGIAAKMLTNLDYKVYDLGAFAKIDLPKEI
ncbi:MAG: rhodanese-like domain-containing protein [Bacilli bacterium]|nr:rhodanese-like domain-containing protein [Bacilli bacterium]